MIRRLFRLPNTRARAQRDLETEFAFHFQERVEELMAQGMDRDEAERDARERFGDANAYKRQVSAIDERILKQQRRTDVTDAVRSELRHAARALARSPIFSIVAVLTLALGIGATTAIFTVLDRVVLRPLPYPDANRLVRIRSAVSGATASGFWGVSVAGYLEYRRHNHTFEDIGVFRSWMPTITDEGNPQRVRGALVTASLVRVLGLRAAVGRPITAADDRAGEPNVVVLGNELWKARYGGDPGIVGRPITVEGSRMTVIGVMASGMELPDERVDLWFPLPIDSLAPPVNDHSSSAIGRLKSGVTLADAQRDLAALTERFPELFPAAYSSGFMHSYHFAADVISARDVVLGNIGGVLWILLASVGLVLLIACANVANLFLVRLELRQREVAIRRALGASRLYVTLHYVSESSLIAGAAGAIGLALAFTSIALLLSIAPTNIPRLAEVHLDTATVVFAFGLSLCIGLVFGIWPSLRKQTLDLGAREGSRLTTASRSQLATRDVLLVGQVALALVLLADAALLVQSFRNLRNAKPGFDPAGAATFTISLPSGTYKGYQNVETFYRRLDERLAGMPGVTAVGITDALPLDQFSGAACSLIFAPDRPIGRTEPAPCIPKPIVGPSYFQAMHIPLRGRAPTWTETEQGTAGVVISETLARRLWPGEDALGKSIGNASQPPFYRVIGVAADVRDQGLDQPAQAIIYYPLIPATGTHLWGPANNVRVVLRTSNDNPLALTDGIRRAVAELDPHVPIANLESMGVIVARSMARISFATLLLGISAAMALLLSAIGVFGAIAFVVSQRRREIGVRIALGARPASVSGRIVVQALRLGVIGAVLGVIGALATTRVLNSLLVGISASDPWILIIVTAILLAVVAVASFLPARRAGRVSPVEALRAE
ncbi:MAG TPA: ABC transporter permease [Gemmatimonadaceae bacterium]|nr:ABC transporter permease [Gemmatimonadaceae bacterium]